MNVHFQHSKKEDVHELVPLIYSSGPAAFDYVFKTKNKSAQDFLKFAFQKDKGEFSFSTHTTVFVNHEIVGVGAVFSGIDTFSFTISAIISILQFYKWNTFGVLWRGIQVEKIIKPPQKKELTIAHLGVKKNFRGKGIGKKLVEFLIQSQESRTFKKVILDVSEQNPAKILYEKLGFEVAITNKSTLKRKRIIVPHHYRMEKQI